jgi:hypothetical protein
VQLAVVVQHGVSGAGRFGCPDKDGLYHVFVLNELMVGGGGTHRWPVAVVGADCIGSVRMTGSVGRRRAIAAAVRSES